MDKITCYSCTELISKETNFCHNCGTRQKCPNCEVTFIQKVKFCPNCGNSVEVAKDTGANTIELNIEENRRTFKASFSDVTAGLIGDKITSLVTDSTLSSKPNATINSIESKKERTNDFNTIDTNYEEVPKQEDGTNGNLSDGITLIDQIFRVTPNKTEILTIDLKAENPLDYAKKMTYLFAYRGKLIDEPKVSRKMLNAILQDCNVYSGGYRGWVAKEANLINDASTIELRTSGVDLSKQILHGVFDANTKGQWKPGDAGRKKASNEKGTSKKASSSLAIDPTLNLLGDNKVDSFKDFCSKRKITTAIAMVTVAVYYLQKIKGHENININAIYTCFKDVSFKLPSNFKGAIKNSSASNYRLVETESFDDIKITTRGENHVEIEYLAATK